MLNGSSQKNRKNSKTKVSRAYEKKRKQELDIDGILIEKRVHKHSQFSFIKEKKIQKLPSFAI